RSRHLYDFQIDDHGIIRTSNTGVTLVPWADVSAIRRYSRGYMMVLKRGTLPIPFRCLSGAQAGVMDIFAATLRPARRWTGNAS
ncbi:MAG: YcxB family protein, partial [Telluria sp.]